VSTTAGRRMLNTETDNHHEVARQHLQNMEDAENQRFVAYMDFFQIRPTRDNPRFHDLQRAGVTDEVIQQLKMKEDEPTDTWLKRLDDFLDAFDKDANPDGFALWESIFGMSQSIYSEGLLQPIVINNENVILMGECRWHACILCNKRYNPAFVREFPAEALSSVRLSENDRRSGLSAAATVLAVRKMVAEKVGPCGLDNPKIDLELMAKLFGNKKTKSAYYLSFCRLPDGDPLLDQIAAGAFRGIRSAYEACTEHLRTLKADDNDQQASGTTTPMKSPSGTAKRAATPSYSAKYPPVKTRLPGDEGGMAVFSALSNIKDIPDGAKNAVLKALNAWPAAPDKARKNIFATAMNEFFAQMDPDADEGQGQNTPDGAA
jgi:hypothetical protein